MLKIFWITISLLLFEKKVYLENFILNFIYYWKNIYIKNLSLQSYKKIFTKYFLKKLKRYWNIFDKKYLKNLI